MFACIYSPRIVEATSLVEFAYGFSPLVEESATDTVVIDVEGCELLFGSAYQLANEIAERATKPLQAGGLESNVNVALAANPDTAIYAARFFKGITFISPGEELTCLGELPIGELYPRSRLQGPRSEVQNTKSKATPRSNTPTLDPGPWTLDQSWEEILETLKLWGVHTFRDFAALPTVGVSERLGQTGIKLQQLAAGKNERHLNLKQPAAVFENSIELEHPLAELEPLAFILARQLNQLCASLNAYALATNELHLQMKLQDKTLNDRKLSLPYPMRDHKVFLKLLLLDTEMHPPQSGVVAVSIACAPVKPRVLQNGLFVPLAPEPEKLELTLARLAKLVGPDNAGSPELVDTHRPDAFRVKKFVLKGRLDQARHRKTDRRSRQTAVNRTQRGSPIAVVNKRQSFFGFRMFRPPLRATVETSQGCPTQVSAWNRNRSVYGKIVKRAGPWRSSGDWWCDDPWARDEWDVAIETRSEVASMAGPASPVLYRIYRELSSNIWFVEGVYD